MRIEERMRFVPLWISAVLVAVFVLQSFFGSELFILDKSLVAAEPWRVVTPIFAHGSIAHLLSNLFALGLFGLILEGRIGPRKLLLLFLSTGIIVNIFSPYDTSLGASGAIFGILGALVVLRPLMVVWIDFIPMPMIVAGLIWLLSDILGIFIPDNIGHIAHIFGLAIGLFFGFLWRSQGFGDEFSWKKKKRKDINIEHIVDNFEKSEGLR